ncbi:hypothetical protein KRX51_03340 [Corynebacterium sp. TAE3-ERU12]|uniref:hypothetical protein n=1 Tax=Corynebacterium sp. TAE3-ERU12 TaxID=2849491 RepID=UPI001C490AD2|nr:hypothetical protein [Corynebacterium sp. TAE3-ERU12]MBV7294952.1 hypothetical protein [Corynebacterium sp. TAE3-ERU12]
MAPVVDITGRGKTFTEPVVGLKSNNRALHRLFTTGEEDRYRARIAPVSLVPEPDNPMDRRGHAISVRWEGTHIGYLESARADEYWPEIARVAASGVSAMAWIQLFKDDLGDETRFYAKLKIREPGQCVPLNDPPAEPFTLLPDGRVIQVTKEAEHFDVLADYVPPGGTGQLLVSLHSIQTGIRTTKTVVEVRLDEQRIGELSKGTSDKLLAAVQHFEQMDLVPVSRAVIQGSALAAEVTLQCARSEELTDDDLEPEISPAPTLVAFEDDPANYDVPDAWGSGSKPVLTSLGAKLQHAAKQAAEKNAERKQQAGAAQADAYRSYQPEPPAAPMPPTAPPKPRTDTVDPFAPPVHAPTPAVMPDRDISAPTGPQDTTPLIRPRHNPRLRRFLAYFSIFLGVVMLLTGILDNGGDPNVIIGSIGLSGLFLIPPGAWFYYERKDAKAWEEARDQAEAQKYLTETDREFLGLDFPVEPERVRRRWGVVWLVALTIGIAGSAVLPEEPGNEPPGPETGIDSPTDPE